jgi:hypothetical protein
VVAAAGVEDEHAGRQDQPVHGEGQQPGGRPFSPWVVTSS